MRLRFSLAALLATAAATGCGDNDANPADAATDVDLTDVATEDVWDADTSDGSGDVDTADTTDTADVADPARPYPEPGAWPANNGPGASTVTFTEDELYENCAYLDGGDQDFTDHHNLVVMYDGYLVMPWAPEFGAGGVTFFDVSDPCNPTTVGSGHSAYMRETHAMGFAAYAGGEWAAVNYFDITQPITDGNAGIQFWDVSDSTAPEAVAGIVLPGGRYPDSYARVPLSVFYQAPYAYVASADNGIHIVDASDPTNPEFVGMYTFDPIMRAGQVHAVGNLLVVSAAEGPQTALMDISDPTDPFLLNTFLTVDSTDTPRENYFSNVSGGYSWYARKSSGGGLFVYDIRDPMNPVKAGEFHSPFNGGYVFVKEGLAFTGESSTAVIYDVSDLSDIQLVTTLDLEGDLDTLTPIGNTVVLSVDDDANQDQGSAIAPYQMAPDSTPPVLNWVYPNDGATDLALTSRIGITFNEMVDPSSAWEGSVRLYETGTDPALTRVDGYISTQEAIVNFAPTEPLKPATDYTFEVPAGGIVDFNGNPIAETFTMQFRTVE